MLSIVSLITRYLPAILAFKDVSETFKEEHGKDKPFYVSQRFWGVVVTALGIVAGIFFGVKLTPEQITTISDGIVALVTLGGSVYGVVLTVKGAVNAKNRNVEQGVEH